MADPSYLDSIDAPGKAWLLDYAGTLLRSAQEIRMPVFVVETDAGSS
jgi:hypothetical protein